MDLKELQKHIRTLATLPEAGAPVISSYLNLETSRSGYRHALDERVRLLRKSLAGETRRHFEEALGQIEAHLRAGIAADATGLAIFARGGQQPFFLPLQFRVPLPNWIAVNTTPNIYHLVELKDTYHRYMVLISTEGNARILGVNLGAVTEDVWKESPELRERVGREWTKEHYQNHRRERTNRFINELIRVLDQLMSAGGYGHLILAGNPRVTSQIRKALPKHLAAKVVDIVPASECDRTKDVVAATLVSFIEQEERESLAVVDKLQQEVNTHCLAVAGVVHDLQSGFHLLRDPRHISSLTRNSRIPLAPHCRTGVGCWPLDLHCSAGAASPARVGLVRLRQHEHIHLSLSQRLEAGSGKRRRQPTPPRRIKASLVSGTGKVPHEGRMKGSVNCSETPS